jgi:hypothetical protein
VLSRAYKRNLEVPHCYSLGVSTWSGRRAPHEERSNHDDPKLDDFDRKARLAGKRAPPAATMGDTIRRFKTLDSFKENCYIL